MKKLCDSIDLRVLDRDFVGEIDPVWETTIATIIGKWILTASTKGISTLGVATLGVTMVATLWGSKHTIIGEGIVLLLLHNCWLRNLLASSLGGKNVFTTTGILLLNLTRSSSWSDTVLSTQDHSVGAAGADTSVTTGNVTGWASDASGRSCSLCTLHDSSRWATNTYAAIALTSVIAGAVGQVGATRGLSSEAGQSSAKRTKLTIALIPLVDAVPVVCLEFSKAGSSGSSLSLVAVALVSPGGDLGSLASYSSSSGIDLVSLGIDLVSQAVSWSIAGIKLSLDGVEHNSGGCGEAVSSVGNTRGGSGPSNKTSSAAAAASPPSLVKVINLILIYNLILVEILQRSLSETTPQSLGPSAGGESS